MFGKNLCNLSTDYAQLSHPAEDTSAMLLIYHATIIISGAYLILLTESYPTYRLKYDAKLAIIGSARCPSCPWVNGCP